MATSKKPTKKAQPKTAQPKTEERRVTESPAALLSLPHVSLMMVREQREGQASSLFGVLRTHSNPSAPLRLSVVELMEAKAAIEAMLTRVVDSSVVIYPPPGQPPAGSPAP